MNYGLQIERNWTAFTMYHSHCGFFHYKQPSARNPWSICLSCIELESSVSLS